MTTKVKLNDATIQTIGRMKARYFLIQPDGTIKRRGEWAFRSESYVLNAAAGQAGTKVYDKETGQYLEAAIATAVIPVVASDHQRACRRDRP